MQRNQSKPESGTGYLPTLDGWRAIAILMVIASHDRVHSLGSLSTLWFRNHGGERGVDLFFALSGLLIVTRLLQEERLRGRLDLRGFYLRRLCRIQPPALLFLSFIALLMTLGCLDRTPGELLASLLLMRNYLPLHAVQDSWYTGHFWSLAVEEHFYLLLPPFLLLVQRFRLVVLGTLALSIELWRVIVAGHHALQFGPIFTFHTDVAAGPIVFAAFFAVLLQRPQWRDFCLRFLHPSVALVFSASVWTRLALHHSRSDHAALVLTLPLLLVSTMLHPESLLGRVLESAPLRFIGRISYSLYLWQMLFFVFYFSLPSPHSALLGALQQTPMRYLAVFGLAVTSYYLVERPMMRLGHYLARPATPGREDLLPVLDRALPEAPHILDGENVGQPA